MERAVTCVLIPRFALLAAAASRQDLLSVPLALAPDPGGEARIGEASGPAEAYGVRAGMSLGEALARCPELKLIPPDPGRAEAAWERVLRRLEAIGAAVEPGRAGEAFFDAAGLRGLWGGHRRAAELPGSRGLEGVIAKARRAVGAPSRIGVGPVRFCAFAAARRARARRAKIVPTGAARAFLAPLPVEMLKARLAAPPMGASAAGARRVAERGAEELARALERLGIETLGELAALPEPAVADRFGALGLRARRLAAGDDEPLRPRKPKQELVEEIELAEAASGEQLGRALELLVDRLLAQRARRGRTLRKLRVEARLAAGGSWRAEAVLRQASADAGRLRLALGPKLGELPSPASSLILRALELGPPAGEQRTLARSAAEVRRERLGEAVRQVRAAAGRDAVLQVLDVEPDSRVPERRVLLAPFPEPGVAE
jgi:protein ImuB